MMQLNELPDDVATYYNAAIQDEINGYELTAAMEWQKAAELLAHVPSVANLCWQQWERIMQLPRHLATPITAPSQPATIAA